MENTYVVVGCCKECGSKINSSYEMLPDYPWIYECPVCGYPNAKEDLYE